MSDYEFLARPVSQRIGEGEFGCSSFGEVVKMVGVVVVLV
jgi:hypothetical protein